jgi:hypothetical protein
MVQLIGKMAKAMGTFLLRFSVSEVRVRQTLPGNSALEARVKPSDRIAWGSSPSPAAGDR